jgi:hypothetical protein
MASFFRLRTAEADDPDVDRAALAELRRGDVHAVLIRRVFAREEMERVVTVLESNAPGFVRSEFPAAFRAFFYGLNLNLAPPDLGDYFAEEPRFRAALSGLTVPQLEGRIVEVLQRFDCDRSYRAAPGPGPGARHFFTTLRGHGTGAYIPAHFDNESTVRPSYRHVGALIEPRIYSFVLAFSRAEAGGALEFFNLREEEHSARFRNVDEGVPKPDVEGLERVSIRLAPGDMIVLNSGGYLHRVTPVEGARTRWTACSFMAPARQGDDVYCWG